LTVFFTILGDCQNGPDLIWRRLTGREQTMAKIALTPEIFENKSVRWMEDVGPVVFVGDFAFCCEYEADQDPPDILVQIHEKPETIPEDENEMIPMTRHIGKRSFEDENSILHIRNFILKFSTDEQYRKTFITAP
jgi:hypothetical protein